MLPTSRLIQSVVLVAARRTPIGSFGGQFTSLSATQLGSIVVRDVVEKAGLQPTDIKEVIFGNVVGAGAGQAPARQVAIGAGLPESVICTAINKVCSSGLKAIMYGAQTIALGLNDTIVAGGTESMTNTPYYVPRARYGLKYGHGEIIDGIIRDGLADPFKGHMMGVAAEHTARKHEISREQQDEFCVASYRRAEKAHADGLFSHEIVPVSVPQGKGDPIIITDDEEIRKVKYDKISKLQSAFEKGGSVTAANSSKINDGAAALVLMSEEAAKRHGLKPLARILGFADAEQAPIDFPTAPAAAIPLALKQAGVPLRDVDFFEINEAFSVVCNANMKLLGIPHDKLNVNGGAVAMGHPIGCSGARIVVTLTHILRNRGGRIGVAAICNGGGGASAIVIERL